MNRTYNLGRLYFFSKIIVILLIIFLLQGCMYERCFYTILKNNGEDTKEKSFISRLGKALLGNKCKTIFNEYE